MDGLCSFRSLNECEGALFFAFDSLVPELWIHAFNTLLANFLF